MSVQKENEDESELDITPIDPLLFTPAISEENISKKPNWIRQFSGILYALIASFLFVSQTFMIQRLGVDLLDAVLARLCIQTILTFSFVLYKRYTILGGTIWQIFLQIVCCATGTIGFISFLLAVRYVDLADTSTLCYTRVVWTVVLSIIVYRERPSIGTLIALPLTLLGVIFVTQPTFLFPSKSSSMNSTDNKLRIFGFAMAFTCALTLAINVLLFKQLISTYTDIKPSVLGFQSTFSVLICLILNQLYRGFYLHTTTILTNILSWRYLLSAAIALMSIVGSVLTQKAIKREHPAVFSLLGSSDIIFALLLQNIFTSVRSNLYALLGSGLVISSVVVLGISRIINERREQEKIKQKKTENGNQKC
jgi:drug/metabolite transporter (DMT)-like permease